MANKNFNVHPKKKLHNNRPLEASEANEQDAKDLGYTDETGKAVSKSKSGSGGSPTGAYTDIGVGRSSVVRRHEPDDED